jgi:hypothetical protein
VPHEGGQHPLVGTSRDGDLGGRIQTAAPERRVGIGNGLLKPRTPCGG